MQVCVIQQIVFLLHQMVRSCQLYGQKKVEFSKLRLTPQQNFVLKLTTVPNQMQHIKHHNFSQTHVHSIMFFTYPSCALFILITGCSFGCSDRTWISKVFRQLHNGEIDQDPSHLNWFMVRKYNPSPILWGSYWDYFAKPFAQPPLVEFVSSALSYGWFFCGGRSWYPEFHKTWESPLSILTLFLRFC